MNETFRRGDENPWFFGANFTPSTAINQLEFWQEDTFDPETIGQELGFAESIGMNMMRVFLHDLLWQADPDGFSRRIDTYLNLAEKRGIKTMFVIFDDCWREDPQLGIQSDPIPNTHNSGWVQSPGLKVLHDESQWPHLEKYVTQLLGRFKDDQRIAVWDLYNEPGNAPAGAPEKHAQSARLLAEAFQWARSAAPAASLTAGLWKFDAKFESINEITTANSDIVTFHSYDPPQMLTNIIEKLKETCDNRPMICTEYMARPMGSNFQDCLPILRKYNIGAINWGLVSGKTQTIYPWDWIESKGPPDLFFHDIFNPDGTFLYPEEHRVIMDVTAM